MEKLYDHGQSTKGEQIVSEAFQEQKLMFYHLLLLGNGILVTGIQLNSLHQFVIHVGEGRGEGQSAEQFTSIPKYIR
ncbi:hypothetical protein KHA80_19775 [Anaerobacillus sp. HL2]|nr:hypothetical protein KHA80_19775 [Anaerobacillus sp. HL2]